MASATDDVILDELVTRARAPGAPHTQFRSLASAHQYRHLYRMTRRHLGAGAQVLDWGTGNGHFSYFLTRTGHRVTGYTLEGASYAGWLGNPYERFVTAPIDEPVRLPFPDASFDAVGSVGVLEHVREGGGDEAASLAEIGRVLRPGGLFLCYHLPCHASLIEAVARMLGGHHQHRYRYTRADVERLMRGAGLEILEHATYGAVPRNVFGDLPSALARSRVFTRGIDAVDDGLGALLGPGCQNRRVVARKLAAESRGGMVPLRPGTRRSGATLEDAVRPHEIARLEARVVHQLGGADETGLEPAVRSDAHE
jgi:SAM-dependent methyltransferase